MASELATHVTSFKLQLDGVASEFDCLIEGTLGGLNAEGTALSCAIAAGNTAAVAYFDRIGAVSMTVVVFGSTLTTSDSKPHSIIMSTPPLQFT
jgi:hypothetical protein